MATTPFGSGRIDKLLDIIFTKQVNYLGARTFPEWDMVKKEKASDPLARSVRFRATSELGYAAAGAGRNPGAKSYTFARSSLSKVDEFEGQYKLKTTTVALSNALYRQAQLAKSAKAMEPLTLEMQNKAIAESRIMAAEFWLDGTGVRGTAASVSETAIATGRFTVTLLDLDATRGHASCFEYGDILVAYSVLGVARAASGAGAGSLYGYKVVDRDRFAQTVTFDAIDVTETVLTNITATNIVSGDVFYRVDGQQTFADLTSNATVGDYGTKTEIMPGIESLAAADGRTVFGMVMSGIYKGSQTNVAGDPIDAIHLDQALGEGKNRMGEGRFTYKQMIMDDPTHRQLIDSREADRRFNTYQDNTRGTSYFGYQQRNSNLRAVVSEYLRRRIWLLPEHAAGDKVLEYHGTDWEQVKLGNGQSQFFNPSTDGRLTNEMVSFKEQRGVLLNRAPGAICCIRNYSLSIA